MNFGKRLKHLREVKGLNQEDFANLAGFSQGQVSRWEKGERLNPQLDTLIKLADALGITLDVLAGRDPEQGIPFPLEVEKAQDEIRLAIRQVQDAASSLRAANYRLFHLRGHAEDIVEPEKWKYEPYTDKKRPQKKGKPQNDETYPLKRSQEKLAQDSGKASPSQTEVPSDGGS